ncbi:MAG: T9SS type A sorting domain-containing protein [Ignavibacteriae bacterium]|nr:T9SS type A sorting domain-containing protein [Ignavibacteriota bacterium]
MKNNYLQRLIYLGLIIIFSIKLNSQIISFSGYNSRTLIPVRIDSIYILNTTTNIDTMLVGKDTIDLSGLTEVKEEIEVIGNSAKISQCFPSCFENNTQFSIYSPHNSSISIIVSNNLGSSIIEYTKFLQQGEYQFSFEAGGLPQGIYFINLIDNYNSQTIKVIKYGKITTYNCSIIYQGTSSKLISTVCSEGDKYSYKVYARGYKVSDATEPSEVYNGENFPISLNPLSNFDFTRVEVQLFNLIGIFENTSQSSGEEGHIWYDTLDIDITFSFTDSLPNYKILSENGIEYFDCRKFNSIGDSIGICNEVIFDGHYAGTFRTISNIITAKYNNNYLRNILIVKSDKWHSNLKGAYINDSLLQISIDNISCYFDNDSNLFCMKILDIKDLLFEQKYFHMGGLSIYSRNIYLVSILPKDDFPNLFIKFIK